MIIGSKGMAGHVIRRTLLQAKEEVTVADVARGTAFFTPAYDLDVTNFNLLEKALADFRPDFVINCIGILNADAETNPDKAILLNTYLPHWLAKQGKQLGYKLIHISTDCVFSGKRGNYTEEDFKDGIGFYAQTKALGEVTYDENLTIRTSIIGPELKDNGIGLFDWFMRQSGTIKGYTKAYWSGVTTIVLARAILSVIQKPVNGLCHLVNNDRISKYELLKLINEKFGKQLIIEPYDGYSVDKSLKNTTGELYHVPSYEEMIADMYQWLDSNNSGEYNKYLNKAN